ncbi:MAG: response regulator transcription factor [Bdellovibrionota bacterium]
MTDRLMNILVVEDEKEIRELMCLHLLRQGYKVRESASVEQAQQEMLETKFDLLILDWMLPGANGLQLLQQIRTEKLDTRVLMVTAKTEPLDIVEGLEKGADDYLTKPFDPNIFMARVRALLRRADVNAATQKDLFELDSLAINFATYEVTMNSEKLHLTPSEFKLLSIMVQNQGRVLTREYLIENVQGEGISVVGRTIDTHVFGLRKKLGEWGEHIETIRGVGYRVKLELT